MVPADKPTAHDRSAARRYRPPRATQIAWSGRANQRTPIGFLQDLCCWDQRPGLALVYSISTKNHGRESLKPSDFDRIEAADWRDFLSLCGRVTQDAPVNRASSRSP